MRRIHKHCNTVPGYIRKGATMHCNREKALLCVWSNLQEGIIEPIHQYTTKSIHIDSIRTPCIIRKMIIQMISRLSPQGYMWSVSCSGFTWYPFIQWSQGSSVNKRWQFANGQRIILLGFHKNNMAYTVFISSLPESVHFWISRAIIHEGTK